MNRFNEKNVFRKTISATEKMKKDNMSTFRKGLTERLSSTFRENNRFERIPGHDILIVE